MPYIILNDKDCNNILYYAGLQGIPVAAPHSTVLEESAAERLTLSEAASIMRGRSDLYAAGWRFVPVIK